MKFVFVNDNFSKTIIGTMVEKFNYTHSGGMGDEDDGTYWNGQTDSFN